MAYVKNLSENVRGRLGNVSFYSRVPLPVAVR